MTIVKVAGESAGIVININKLIHQKKQVKLYSPGFKLFGQMEVRLDKSM